MVVRNVCRRSVNSRWHPVRSDPGTGGWRASSIITPSVGLEQPRCVAWEPAFGQDLEWTLLHALSRVGRRDGTSAYFRLTTRPLDQAAAACRITPLDAKGAGARSWPADAGCGPPPGRRTRTRRGRRTHAGGASAADKLATAHIACDVICLNSSSPSDFPGASSPPNTPVRRGEHSG